MKLQTSERMLTKRDHVRLTKFAARLVPHSGLALWSFPAQPQAAIPDLRAACAKMG